MSIYSMSLAEFAHRLGLSDWTEETGHVPRNITSITIVDGEVRMQVEDGAADDMLGYEISHGVRHDSVHWYTREQIRQWNSSTPNVGVIEYQYPGALTWEDS